jgi:Flp pilus assembly protein TadB
MEHGFMNIALAIPIVAIIMTFAMLITAIITENKRKREMLNLYHQERMAAIEKGVELPPLPADAFFDERSTASSPRRVLLKGLIWLFLGIGLAIALIGMPGAPPPGIAAIPIGIGLAYLLYYFAVGRKLADRVEAAEASKQIETKT